MTEYETASLALQQAALTPSYWQTGITLAVSSGLVLYGFRLIRRGSEQRRAEANQQHAATMRTLEARIHDMETVIERTSRKLSGAYCESLER